MAEPREESDLDALFKGDDGTDVPPATNPDEDTIRTLMELGLEEDPAAAAMLAEVRGIRSEVNKMVDGIAAAITGLRQDVAAQASLGEDWVVRILEGHAEGHQALLQAIQAAKQEIAADMLIADSSQNEQELTGKLAAQEARWVAREKELYEERRRIQNSRGRWQIFAWVAWAMLSTTTLYQACNTDDEVVYYDDPPAIEQPARTATPPPAPADATPKPAGTTRRF